ncbi:MULTISPECIES: GntR family transcriptional regulator [Mycobacterium avium complex (MAC)]|uniref:GntR family transcriptional regulator n=6 Tax=Mycobacterium avium complex (MAC) TaxID=120793 RepID=A0A2A3L5T3_MYCAV|nr:MULTISPECIES: GntR family transcriptional regulator [Mycobacterium avium complex (MAC)]ETA91129.1 GntR family transcriptional regulator [Mycobacterium avium 05-4293]ETA98242.1 GntR family transcriptional regulator [Mycobacterium avium 10-5581]ETB09492.1 GntR family transcriptional regulator [Mycobacterium avium subsp. paratuberculosis 08-8281]ETB26222.1 GntR family transcriptional regulator [Mycobacterium avium subsp. hominissuis 10-4249]ETB35711.1 GntR family transcriptional regulator [Myc
MAAIDISGTVRERAARELRDRILTGALPAGSRIDLDAITAEFATSRTPVREALLELSFEGLVQVAPRSGVTVIGISPEDVLDSFTILGVLTGQAAAWAAERIGPEELATLRELAAEVVAKSGDDSIGEANWHFHQMIHRAAHSPRLANQIKHAARVVPTNFLTLFPEHEKHSLDEHAQLLDALGDKDVERARAIAERHVLDAGRSLAEWLEQRRDGER